MQYYTLANGQANETGVIMADTVRTVLALTPEAAEVIDANASERKRGEFVSQVLTEWEAGEDRRHGQGLLERIEARLANIERLLQR